MTMKKRTFLLLTATAILAGTAACAPTVTQRGNMVKNHQMESLVAGTSTKSDVLRAMGSPTTQDPFDENTWCYIGQVKEKTGILDPKVTDERIVMIQFSSAGVMNTLKDVGGDGEDIPYERRKTATSGNEVTVLQQFFGNLGKFNRSSVDKGGVGAPGR